MAASDRITEASVALAELAALGPNESTQKQLWRTQHYRDEVLVLHPTRTTRDGQPAPVYVSAAKVDDFVARGFGVPPAAASQVNVAVEESVSEEAQPDAPTVAKKAPAKKAPAQKAPAKKPAKPAASTEAGNGDPAAVTPDPNA